MKNNTWR